jgi:thiamine-phosphate pyrophosphorylase
MLICVTNQKLCKDDFFSRIVQLAKGKPHAILLREKDLDLTQYEHLAVKIKNICNVYQVPLIIHQNIKIAEKLELENIHLTMSDLELNKDKASKFIVGASVHSVAEAVKAQKLGAAYLIAGHIYSTDSKRGVPPRGLSFLKEVCASVHIPVFAIGGITNDKVQELTQVGTKGICVMSEAMTCSSPIKFINKFQF